MTKTTYLMTMVGGAFAAIVFAIGSVLLTIGIHDYDQSEDVRVVWACSVQGNKKCGPDQPIVDVQISNILYW